MACGKVGEQDKGSKVEVLSQSGGEFGGDAVWPGAYVADRRRSIQHQDIKAADHAPLSWNLPQKIVRIQSAVDEQDRLHLVVCTLSILSHATHCCCTTAVILSFLASVCHLSSPLHLPVVLSFSLYARQP